MKTVQGIALCEEVKQIKALQNSQQILGRTVEVKGHQGILCSQNSVLYWPYVHQVILYTMLMECSVWSMGGNEKVQNVKQKLQTQLLLSFPKPVGFYCFWFFLCCCCLQTWKIQCLKLPKRQNVLNSVINDPGAVKSRKIIKTLICNLLFLLSKTFISYGTNLQGQE